MIKRGEVSVSFIVGLILVILGFLILFFLWTQLGWSGIVDDEVCHTSVVLRGTVPGVLESSVPLKCRANKICITSGLFGGNCDKDFENAKGVVKVKVRDVHEIEKIISESVVSCWSTMGEGKLSLFTQTLKQDFAVPGEITTSGIKVGFTEPRCVVCSRLAFDAESLGKSNIHLKDLDVATYMATRKMPGSEKSYAQRLGELTDGNGGFDLDSFSYKTFEEEAFNEGKKIIINQSKPEDAGTISYAEAARQDEKNSGLQNHEMAIVFMQVAAPKHWDVFKNSVGIGATAGAIGFVGKARVGGIGKAFTTAKKIGKSVFSKAGLVFLTAAGVLQQESVAYNRAIAAGYCGDVTAGDKAYDGCSAVRTINYDERLGDYCGQFDNLP